MLTFFLYLMKSVLCLALFYPFYMVLLSRETFHRFNRMALISILLASVVIPACRITTEEPLLLTQLYQRWENWLTGQEAETVAAAYVDWAEMEMTAMPIAEGEVLTPASTFSLLDFLSAHWSDLLFMLYVGGILFLLGRHVVSIVRLFALLRQGKLQRLDDGTRLYLHNRSDIAPFSWMKYIVISEADYRENGRQIVAHEQAHISNGHSWDLLLVELCLLAQWFNPAAWLIRQELQNIHEYEADDTVLRRGINAKEYQLLIIKKAVGARLYSLANSLNHSSLKKRLTMMMKRKSNPWARAKYLYVLPLAAISMVAFAHTEAANNSNGISEAKGAEVLANDQISSEKSLENEEWGSAEEVFMVVENMPEFPGGTAELMKFLAMNICYPVKAQKENVQGRVVVQFVVSKTGKIIDPTIAHSVSPELDAEAIRVIKAMPDWKPGTQRGQAVNVKFNVPISFRLDGSKGNEGEEESDIRVIGYNNKDIKAVYSEPREQKSATKTNNEDFNLPKQPVKDVDGDEVFQVVEKMPQFPGGTAAMLEFLKENIVFPQEARKKSIEGRVIIQFTIKKTGEVSNPTIVRSVSPELDAEAIRVIKAMPKWTPGEQKGEPVNVKFTLPVQFRLQ